MANGYTSDEIGQTRPMMPSHKAFTVDAVRDLAWILEPEYDLLLSSAPYSRYLPRQDWEWLEANNQHPELLERHLNQSPHRKRLGLYYEDLICYYLQCCPASNAQLMYHQFPVRSADGRTTLGELDFLVEIGGDLCHLEVAVKFYLGQEIAGANHWLGPNSSDTWERKISRMRRHQLPVSEQISPVLGRPVARRYFWVKGLFFHPWPERLGLPQGINPAADGTWLRVRDLESWVASTEFDWTVLPRARWLGGLGAPEMTRAAMSGSRLADTVRRYMSSKNALMLESDSSGGECRRTMIVNDDWPDSAT